MVSLTPSFKVCITKTGGGGGEGEGGEGGGEGGGGGGGGGEEEKRMRRSLCLWIKPYLKAFRLFLCVCL